MVFGQNSVRSESWGKEMTTLANMDEPHDTRHAGEVSWGWDLFRAVSKGTVASQLPSVAFPQGQFQCWSCDGVHKGKAVGKAK